MNTNFNRAEFRIVREPWNMRGQFDVRIFHRKVREGVETISYVEPLSLKTMSEESGGEYLAPTFAMLPEEAQQLMDELWRVGVRPTEGSDSTGQLAAVQRHLEDMRSLVFTTEAKP